MGTFETAECAARSRIDGGPWPSCDPSV